jgi:hypothetical protein
MVWRACLLEWEKHLKIGNEKVAKKYFGKTVGLPISVFTLCCHPTSPPPSLYLANQSGQLLMRIWLATFIGRMKEGGGGGGGRGPFLIIFLCTNRDYSWPQHLSKYLLCRSKYLQLQYILYRYSIYFSSSKGKQALHIFLFTYAYIRPTVGNSRY